MLPTELYHYSKEKIDTVEDRYSTLDQKNSRLYKPIGFWISVEQNEDDQTWKTWCESENFELEHLTHRYLIKINDGSKILHLRTEKELKEFSHKYSLESRECLLNKKKYVYLINWTEVCKIYQGIIIEPYNWECRLDIETNWYYGWDCASGCIWDVTCIDKIELMDS